MVETVSYHPDPVRSVKDVSSPQGEALDEDRGEPVSGLTSYLAQLGLNDEQLGNVMSLLEPMEGQEPAEADAGPSSEMETGRAAADVQKTVSLYIAEEQPILKEAYQSFFNFHSSIEMVGASEDTGTEALIEAALRLKPQVMLLGVKRVQKETVEKLESIREACPGMGLVLLFAFFDADGVRGLREFARHASGGRAYLLKHTIDTVEQLTQVVCSVDQGRVIIDPMVMEEMIRSQDTHNGFLRELSPRSLEVLSWMAKGYRNEGIAEVLSRDVKTIERYINHIYTSLQGGVDNAKHPRVQAALMYLRATGLLSTEQPWEE